MLCITVHFQHPTPRLPQRALGGLHPTRQGWPRWSSSPILATSKTTAASLSPSASCCMLSVAAEPPHVRLETPDRGACVEDPKHTIALVWTQHLLTYLLTNTCTQLLTNATTLLHPTLYPLVPCLVRRRGQRHLGVCREDARTNLCQHSEALCGRLATVSERPPPSPSPRRSMRFERERKFQGWCGPEHTYNESSVLHGCNTRHQILRLHSEITKLAHRHGPPMDPPQPPP